jgi:signal transduction histidine kinase
VTTSTLSMSLWEQWLGRRGALRTQLIVWNILALTLLLGVLGTVIRQTVHSFLISSVNSELERQAQRMRLPPPPRHERGPRPDSPEGPPPFKRLKDRQILSVNNFSTVYEASIPKKNDNFFSLHLIRYYGLQGPPPDPPHDHEKEDRFPGPRDFGGRPGPPPPLRDLGLYRPHHFDLQGQSIVSWDDRPMWDTAGFNQAKQGRRQYATVVVDGETLQVLSDPVRERGVVVAVVQVAYPLADVQLAIAGLDRALLTLIPIGLLFSGLGGAYVTNRVLRRVHLTTQTAREITVGDFSTRLPVSGNDEFSELAETFNGLLNRLQSAFQQQELLLEQQRRFTADASHELKTPLTVIKGTTSMTLHGAPTVPAYRAALQDIDRAADTMSHLVQDLLLLARSDGGQLGKEQIELLVCDILDSTVSGIRQESAPLTLHVDDETLSVMGNERELVRLFSNVLDNAVHHTPSDGTIQVSAQAEGENVVITVRDTGPGIPPEHLPHVGERFYRVDAARSRPDGGTGLGLSICKGIVHAHGGTLSIESTSGVGTTVHIRLPRFQ